jgi:5-methylcytosine-specific restriction endonuclease McrA
MQESARAAGLPIDGLSLLGRMFNSSCRWATFWEHRVARLTAQLQAALAIDALNDPERAAIVKTIAGSPQRDAKLLTASEREYLDELQRLPREDRAAVRRIVRGHGRHRSRPRSRMGTSDGQQRASARASVEGRTAVTLMCRSLRLVETNRRVESAITALQRLPYREYLRTAHWQRVRLLALERARHACALCPATDRLQVHHRSYARRGFEQPEDVIVLCDDCHARHHLRA